VILVVLCIGVSCVGKIYSQRSKKYTFILKTRAVALKQVAQNETRMADYVQRDALA
jgi:hypothetical protein